MGSHFTTPKTSFNKRSQARKASRRSVVNRPPVTLGTTVLHDNSDPAVEVKFSSANLTTSFGSVGVASVATDVLSAITQGDDINARTGRTINVKDILLQGTLIGGQSNAVTDDNINTFRIMCYESASGVAPTAVSCNTFLNTEATALLGHVYCDIIKVLQPPGRDSTGYMPAMFPMSIRIPINKRFKYAATTGAASPTTLYLVMVSDSAAVSNPGFTLGAYIVRFTDL